MSQSTGSGVRPGARFFLIVGWLAVVALLAAFAWQTSVKNSKTDEAGNHLAVATLIESAEADGVASGALLQQYVQTGDATLLPQMQEKTDSGVRKLTSAINEAGGDPNGFVAEGSAIVQAAGQVIAMRQSNDVAGAAARLTELGTQFNEFIAAQDAFVVSERAKAVEATNSADSAQNAALWLLISAAVGAISMAAATAIVIIGRLGRREESAQAPTPTLPTS